MLLIITLNNIYKIILIIHTFYNYENFKPTNKK